MEFIKFFCSFDLEFLFFELDVEVGLFREKN